MSGDDYVRVEAPLVIPARDKALLLENGNGDEVWVPRSCIHAADDIASNDMMAGTLHIWRMRRWFAEREGFI